MRVLRLFAVSFMIAAADPSVVVADERRLDQLGMFVVVDPEGRIESAILAATGTKRVVKLQSVFYTCGDVREGIFIRALLERKVVGGIREGIMHAGLFVLREKIGETTRIRIASGSFPLDEMKPGPKPLETNEDILRNIDTRDFSRTEFFFDETYEGGRRKGISDEDRFIAAQEAKERREEMLTLTKPVANAIVAAENSSRIAFVSDVVMDTLLSKRIMYVTVGLVTKSKTAFEGTRHRSFLVTSGRNDPIRVYFLDESILPHRDLLKEWSSDSNYELPVGRGLKLLYEAPMHRD